MNQIYTIGHSNHDIVTFLGLLSSNSIDVVVDIRSAPYSKYVSHFNKREVERAVQQAGLKYIFMGAAIGGKPSSPELLDKKGRGIYSSIASLDSFKQGINRLIKGVHEGLSIALMCAEKDPLKCHRHELIAKELEFNHAMPVWHIRADGSRIRAKKHLRAGSVQQRLF